MRILLEDIASVMFFMAVETIKQTRQTIMKLLTLTLTVLAISNVAHAESSPFFPDISITETNVATSIQVDPQSGLMRQDFADYINLKTADKPYPPQVSAQLLGENGEALLITAHNNNFISTKYRARAAMARFSSITRTMPVFVENGIGPYVDFVDMLHMVGFKALILSDGNDFSYQVNIGSEKYMRQ